MNGVLGIFLTALAGATLIVGPLIANAVFEFVQDLSARLDSLNPTAKRAIIAFATVLFVQGINQIGIALNWTDLTAVTSQEWSSLIAVVLGQLFKTQDSTKALKVQMAGIGSEVLHDTETIRAAVTPEG